jgi:hypothetical protein
LTAYGATEYSPFAIDTGIRIHRIK